MVFLLRWIGFTGATNESVSLFILSAGNNGIGRREIQASLVSI